MSIGGPPYRSSSRKDEADAALDRAIRAIAGVVPMVRGMRTDNLTPDLLREYGEALRLSGVALIAVAEEMERAAP